jgi:hypothetical protein
VPPSLPLEQAGALPLVGLTAWQALAPAKPEARGALGERVLVHAGAGGVGHIAVQLAKAAGLTVVATCGPANVEFVRDELGADEVVVVSCVCFERRDVCSSCVCSVLLGRARAHKRERAGAAADDVERAPTQRDHGATQIAPKRASNTSPPTNNTNNKQTNQKQGHRLHARGLCRRAVAARARRRRRRRLPAQRRAQEHVGPQARRLLRAHLQQRH